MTDSIPRRCKCKAFTGFNIESPEAALGLFRLVTVTNCHGIESTELLTRLWYWHIGCSVVFNRSNNGRTL